MPQKRILLIDDHAMFRTGLAVLLHSGFADLEVDEAGTLDAALHSQVAAPDVVVLDIILRGLNGLEGIALLRRKWPQTPIIMLSSDATPQTVSQALARGAAAFVSKENTADNILSVLRQVLGPALPPAPPSPGDPANDVTRLTPRQLEVLDLLCQGLPNKSIGRRLDLSENTVRWHVQAILAFLQVSTRSEAAFAARSMALIH